MPAKKTVEPEEGAVTSESLAAEVADEKLEYPEGTPVLVPLLALPRMRRADAYEALGQVTTYQRQVKTADGDGADGEDDAEPELDDEGNPKPREIDPASFGAQYRVVAYVEEYLRTVAASPKAFDEWAAKVPDSDLITTFNVYLRKAQPGEAESSTG
jgi:hypothetical protein